MDHFISSLAGLVVGVTVITCIIQMAAYYAFEDSRWHLPLMAGSTSINLALTTGCFSAFLAHWHGQSSFDGAIPLGIGIGFYLVFAVTGIAYTATVADKGKLVRSIIGYIDIPTISVRKLLKRIQTLKLQA